VDAVTTLGTGIDGSVRRIETAYDSQGNPYLITSFNAATGGSVVNQVERTFNGLGQLAADYQATTGTVNTSTTPKVQYAYNELSGGANNSRPTSMTYPSGYALSYTYGSGLDTTVSRLTAIADIANTLESFKYLGLGTVVERDHPQPAVNLTYISQTGGTGDGGDQYVGLDRFGRVVDQNWYNTSTSKSVEDVQYGYDAASNVLWRNDTVNTAFGELYTYDGLNQLATFQRGTLNSTKTGLTGAATASQSWTPDALGNFARVTTNGSTQTRTANQQNEVTAVSGATTPVFDAAGEMTTDETGLQYGYDAWGRIVAVKNSGGSTLETLTYDGLGRQVTSTSGGTTTTFYYSALGQLVEEWQGGAVQARNIWSPVYVKALLVRDQSSLHNGTLDQRLYAVQDANWNVTALLNSSGSVVERYAYLSYGTVTVMNASWTTISGSAYASMYLFQGMRLDAVSGLYEAMTRWASASLGRWTDTDPLGLAAGDLNVYRFIGNSPISAVDPLGMAPDIRIILRTMPYWRIVLTIGVSQPELLVAALTAAGFIAIVKYQHDTGGPPIPSANTIDSRDGAFTMAWLVGKPKPLVYLDRPLLTMPECPKKKPKVDPHCQDQFEEDCARCDRIAKEMKELGADPAHTARWLQACHRRATERFNRCNDGQAVDDKPPYPAPWDPQ
jgi:RHS repeat-associated protein